MSDISDSDNGRRFQGMDAGAPMPDLSAKGIQLSTIAPALGVPRKAQPDYLDYDTGGRGIVVTMFANAGLSYTLGIVGGGLYGLREGLANTPSSRFKVKLNSVLNHCGRHGSRAGNVFGVLSIMYSLYEWQADKVRTHSNMSPSPSLRG
jgi:import inner membrane translocase subunit TIM23